MPNFTDNTVFLKAEKGKEALVEEFIEKFKKDNFEAFIPIPEEIEGINEQVDFAYRNWGTKGLDPESLGTGKDFICFQSAWEPPYKFFINVSKDYPDITFTLEWVYDGEHELHKAVIKNGEEIHYEKALFIISDHIDYISEEDLEELKESLIDILERSGKAIIDEVLIEDKKEAIEKINTIFNEVRN